MMKVFTTIFFSALGFIASSQVFIKASQLKNNCINSMESNGMENNPDFSGCIYDTFDELSQTVHQISEYKNAEVISQIVFNIKTGQVKSTYTPFQQCEYFEDGRLKSRVVRGENGSLLSSLEFKIEKDKYFINMNKTYDNQGKLIDCVGKGCE
jgi:hypothetical protein